MNNNILSLPGYRLYEYKIVLQPHDELWNKIIQVKKDFAQKFEEPAAEWGKPQMTLATFSQLQMMEERVCNRLRIIAMAMPAFKVELQGFGSYPTHSIFIQVESKVPLQMVVRHLKTAQPLLKTNENKPHFMDNFFINIARQLLPWQYEKSWKEFSQKHFSGRFIAKNMLLLRRSEGVKSFQPIARFDFLNMPVITRQGALF
ncbi:MAG: 2'-5' RNA ligase family protein [Chitinophagaceae bacterium]|nr:2'-5' RNA ligase family protein [Chitinophagaceae bacterium]